MWIDKTEGCEVSFVLLLLVCFAVRRTSERTRPLAGSDSGMREEPTLPPCVNSLCGSSTKAPVTECDSWEPRGLSADGLWLISLQRCSTRPVPIAQNALKHQEVDQRNLRLNSLFPVVRSPAHTEPRSLSGQWFTPLVATMCIEKLRSAYRLCSVLRLNRTAARLWWIVPRCVPIPAANERGKYFGKKNRQSVANTSFSFVIFLLWKIKTLHCLCVLTSQTSQG